MNSSPIALRLASGSSRPASLSKKRFSASTRMKCIPESLKAASTSSPSFLRIKPWSTKIQVNWSPTALEIRAAATELSTPPDNANNTLPSPTVLRISSIAVFA